MQRFSVIHGLGNFTGAFADAAVLLPLLIALALTTGYSGTLLLASAGLLYIGSGLWFRIPMPIQPLKSVVVTALTIGATMTEIRISGFVLGVLCLLLVFLPANRWADKVPRVLVHGLQFGLGLLLIIKGLGWNFDEFDQDTLTLTVGVILIALALVYAGHKSALPLMGWLATLALIFAIVTLFWGEDIAPIPPESPASQIRIDIILALLLPQLALTLTNSVVATRDVAERYYGAASKRVTARALLASIGGGNILSALIAGLPFCHGSGGLTAHKAGGAMSWHMTLIIGGTLLLLALIHHYLAPVIPAFHPWVIGVLLTATGLFHLKLALPSIQDHRRRYLIFAMALTTLVSHNLLVVLAVGALLYIAARALHHYRKRTS